MVLCILGGTDGTVYIKWYRWYCVYKVVQVLLCILSGTGATVYIKWYTVPGTGSPESVIE